MRTALIIITVLFFAGCSSPAPVTQKDGKAMATGTSAETVKKVPAGKLKAKPKSIHKTYISPDGQKHTDAKAFATGTETKIP
jgi:PBP1b-binding outer membrane lipoprotein LpoB